MIRAPFSGRVRRYPAFLVSQIAATAFARFMAYPRHALLNLSAASLKKTRTCAVRLTGSVAVPAYEVQCTLARQNS